MTLGSLCSRAPKASSTGCRRRSLGAPSLLLLAACVLPGTLGCKGSVKAEAKASSSGESEVDFDASSKRDEAWESEALPSSSSSSARSSDGAPSGQAGAPAAMLGARHDLTARGTTPTCQCLVVLAGEPSRAGLSWSGSPPVIDAKTQLVVALTSDGVSCPVDVPRASYMGYEVRDADVVIRVEGAVAGRPLTQGAIVPRPTSGGKLIIESAAALPYGKPVSGSGSCTVTY